MSYRDASSLASNTESFIFPHKKWGDKHPQASRADSGSLLRFLCSSIHSMQLFLVQEVLKLQKLTNTHTLEEQKRRKRMKVSSPKSYLILFLARHWKPALWLLWSAVETKWRYNLHWLAKFTPKTCDRDFWHKEEKELDVRWYLQSLSRWLYLYDCQ